MTGATVAFGAAAFVALEVAPVASGPAEIAAKSISEQPGTTDDASSGAADRPAETKQVSMATDEADDADTRPATTAKPLESENPRWAAADGTRRANERHDGIKALAGAVDSSSDGRGVDREWATRAGTANAYASGPPTEAIEPAVPETDPEVAIAESEAEVAALEDKMREDEAATGATDEAIDSDNGADATDEAAPAPSISTESLRAAVATDHVNMRARPASSGSVLVVVPKDAAIRADGDCESWCGATYNGQRGFIFRDYVSFEQEAAAQQEARPEEQSAAAIESEQPSPEPINGSGMPRNAR